MLASAPPLFDSSVRLAAIRYSIDGLVPKGCDVPAVLKRAVPKRTIEFLAGRRAAAHALARLSPSLAGATIGIGANRAPIWPAGVVGSITHAHGFAAAGVADARAWRGLGIDSEKRMPAEQARQVAEAICAPEEFAALPRVEDPETSLTILFSAKESLFKCLNPLVGQWFDFLDAELVALSPATGDFVLRLRRRLSNEFDAGVRIEGRFVVDGQLVHTGIALPG